MAFLTEETKNSQVVLLSDLPEYMALCPESYENRRGEYKQIQADIRLDRVSKSTFD